jgi:hypothetical protein
MKQRYFQINSYWGDRDNLGHKYQLTYGRFSDEKEAEEVAHFHRIHWQDGNFVLDFRGQHYYLSDCIFKNKDGASIKNTATLYRDRVDQYAIYRLKPYRSTCIETIEYDLDIHRAYQEVWRVVYMILNAISDNILDKKPNNDGVIEAQCLLEKACELMQGNSFDPAKHEEKLAFIDRLINFELYTPDDYLLGYDMIKHGQCNLTESLYQNYILEKDSLLHVRNITQLW